MLLRSFFDKDTATFTHVVADPATRRGAVIDPVMGYDAAAGITLTAPVDAVIAYLRENSLKLEWILETHIHADHLTAASHLKQTLGGKIGIGAGILEVLKHWAPLFNNPPDLPLDGSSFDHLFKNGESFRIGGLEAKTLSTPGHTPDGLTYLIGDAAFVGDTLFMPRGGTARADFPGGGAAQLYHSIQKILALPEATRIFICHDYPPENQPPACESRAADHKKDNVLIGEGTDEARYAQARRARDQTLSVPKLLYPALQVNLRAGRLPAPEANDISYLKIPLNLSGGK